MCAVILIRSGLCLKLDLLWSRPWYSFLTICIHGDRPSSKHVFGLAGRSRKQLHSLPALTALAWGKGELSPCRRLPAGDKRFRVFLPAFVSAALYLGITPGSWSITPLQSGSPQRVACSPFRAVTQERQCSAPVGSAESSGCFIVSWAHWGPVALRTLSNSAQSLQTHSLYNRRAARLPRCWMASFKVRSPDARRVVSKHKYDLWAKSPS